MAMTLDNDRQKEFREAFDMFDDNRNADIGIVTRLTQGSHYSVTQAFMNFLCVQYFK